ncbi:MAG: hypothetical protein U1E39_07815 [Planctomycetota bacterium]
MTADPDRDDLRDAPPDERRDDLPDALVALRERVEGHHPSATLKDAVLRDLPDREARRPWSPRRLGARARVALGLAAAAALVAPTFLLRRDGDRASRPPAIGWSPLAPDVPAEIEAARARNLEAYAREKARLHRDLVGKWVVIAERDPATVEGAYKPVVVGETLDDVAAFGAELPHRFVFRVGEEGDLETFASEWYGPRFAGSGFVKAMGLTSFGTMPGGGVELRRGDDAVTFGTASPFPRIRIGIEAAIDPEVARSEPREVFFGSVGPTLMLTPEDDARLRLARWEVPGTETVAGVPCRRVLVRVAIPDLEVAEAVVAAVPAVARETLVAMARERHRFWTWSDEMRASLNFEEDVVPAGEPRWVVFGNDRVLGVGRTVEAALAEADSFRDVVYHRYVTPWPMPTPPAPESRWGFDAVVEVERSGVRLAARVPNLPWDPNFSADVVRARHPVLPVFVPRMTEAEWIAAGLARAEDASPVVWDREGLGPPAAPPGATLRAAWANARLWPKDAPDAVRSVFARLVAYVVPR